jgi:hypothetical protein
VKEILIRAKSSSSDYYTVICKIQDVITIYCDCKAGSFGKLCKHKMGLLSGDRSFLYDTSQEPLLDELERHVKSSEFNNLEKELSQALESSEIAKKNIEHVKRKIEKALNNGLQIISNI